jgi:hypothetical protein
MDTFFTRILYFSTDMLEKVKVNQSDLRSCNYNSTSNQGTFNTLWRTGKLAYYKIFAKMYGWVGSYVDLAIVSRYPPEMTMIMLVSHRSLDKFLMDL